MNKKIIVIIVVVFLILITALCIFLKKREFNKNGKEIQKEVRRGNSSNISYVSRSRRWNRKRIS